MRNDAHELITTTQAAYVLGVSVSTVARAARRSELPYVQRLPGSKGAYLFDPDVIEEERKRRLALAEAKFQCLMEGLR